jgi:DNA gyrase subunit B
VLDAFPTHYPRPILEQAALAGAFDPGRADDDLQLVADTVAKRLNMIAPEFERGWQGRITQDHGIRLSRILRGVEELRTLDGAVLRSGEARRLSRSPGSTARSTATPPALSARTASRRSTGRSTS